MKLALALILAASPAFAQQNCGPRPAVVEFLAGPQYGEAIAGQAMGDMGLYELWGNEETGTWTITVTDPNGLMCVRFSGDGGFVVPVKVPQGEEG